MTTISCRSSVGAARHPDRDLCDRIEHAMRWWLSRSPAEAGVAMAGVATSALTGGGAIAAVEYEFSRLHDGRPALLLPSATYGLRTALAALAIQAGDEVLIPALDWTATTEAVRSLGAIPVPVAVDDETLTMSAPAAAAARSERTRAVVACHLHGVAADVPQLIETLPGLPVVEDCAGALGSVLDSRPVGALGNAYAVFSFGPGKSIDAGEGGLLIAARPDLLDRALAVTAHPLRRLLAGLVEEHPAALSIRPNAVAAICALYGLSRWDVAAARADHRRGLNALADTFPVLGAGGRRENAQRWIPVRSSGEQDIPASFQRSGARVVAERGSPLFVRTRECLDRTWLAPAGPM